MLTIQSKLVKSVNIILLISIMLLISGCFNDEVPEFGTEQSWINVSEDGFNYEAIGSGQLSFRRLSLIYLLDAGNSSTKKLENNWAVIHSAVLSPDGKTIAMAALRKFSQNTQIYLIGTDEPNVRSISSSDHTSFWLSWVPEGKDIIYLDLNSYGLYSQSTINTGDSGLRLIKKFSIFYSPSSPFSVSISGHLTFFVASVPNNATGEITERGLYSIDMKGENLQLLSEGNNTYSPYSHASPQWSPDGRQIAYISLVSLGVNEFDSLKINVMDKDGTNIKTVLQMDIPPGQTISIGFGSFQPGITLSWSPDGSKIAFTKLEGNFESHIYIVDIKTLQVEQVTFGDGVTDYFVSWSE